MRQRILVTGATSGIGRAAAFALAADGHEVLLAGRSRERVEGVIVALNDAHPGSRVEGVVGDLSTLAGVGSVAEQVRDRTDHLDALVNNAGALFTSLRMTDDGFEQTLALNHLAPFALTCELLPLLGDGSRVVTTASEMHRLGRLDPDNLDARGVFVPPVVYGSSKLANILFTRELARRLEASGIGVHCFHPGVVRTGFGKSDARYVAIVWAALGPILRSPEEGARTLTMLAGARQPAQLSGTYWIDGAPAEPHRKGQDDALAARLWERSAELTGLDLPAPLPA
jgi:retinol dehydrogenase 12